MRRLLFSVLLAAACHGETILVLPFFNQSKSAGVDWIGESIAETIRESLATHRLLVLEREDRLEAFRRLSLRSNAVLTKASIIKVGETLDAGRVVYGQYEAADPAASSKSSLRITARILDLQHMRQGPEFTAAGALEDLALLETNVGWQLLKFLAPKTAPSEQEFRQERPPVRVDAIESYVRGLLAATTEQKHRLFAQAARLDTRFSEPCFQLGKINWQRKDYAVAGGWLERVTRADSHYLEALFLLGLCRYYTSDFSSAEKCFQEVAASVPLNEVINNLGAAQSRLKMPAAADSFRKALEGDSTDPDYYFNLGYALWKSGQFPAAADSFRAVLDRSPQDAEAVSFLGRCLKKDGPRPGDPKSEGRERLKTAYEETAYRQLKAELEAK